MVADGDFSHKIDYVTLFFVEILNPKGYPNRITGSKVTTILLKGWSFIGKGLRLLPAQQACFKRRVSRVSWALFINT